MASNRSIIASLFVPFLFMAYPLVAQNDLKEQITVSLSDPAKPGFLNVGLVNGSIRVTGYSGKDIVINAIAAARKSDKEEKGDASANGMKRIAAGANMDISAEEKDNHVKVSSDSWKRPIDLTIKVPQRCSLKLSTVNQGEITVENVNGALEVTNVNGAIQLSGIAGSVVANTVNGNLIVSFKAVDANVPMAFSTLNGNVDVTFPANAKASVKLKSDRGDVYSDFDIDVDKGPLKTTRTEKNGMYRVTVEDWVRGKINGGGPEMMMKNMNGNIYIRKAK
ncbi:DUF4097 family beta strand repeat-containing protein [Spirosoma sp. RP8]|uniref:DUF4097 family beta strand repeat-containing protein n=1 Tax=Spirosoma liriopis TaxID=2937440 RepID=A0ABT0HU12_9BACT|nr:DUF4097 family beta strand repeat-containing protein [Spirosoma liriopis]MCK8495677.1 DUF4097 family beta strand repeat-containing protein [Spirosoma liriopis]